MSSDIGGDPYGTPVHDGPRIRYIDAANGALSHWDAEKQQRVQIDQIVGALERVGEYYHDYKTNFPGWRLELVLKDRDGGLTAIGCNREAVSAACSLAKGIRLFKKGEVLAVTVGGEGKATYFTFHKWDGMGWKTQETWKERIEHADALETVRGHEAFGERPKRRDPEAQTARDAFFQEAVAHGWPAPTGIESKYRAVCAKALGRDVKSLDDLSDADWHTLFEGVAKAKGVPKLLQLAKTASAPEGDYDPFADE